MTRATQFVGTLVLTAALTSPAPTLAESPTWEITPTIGYRTGGGFQGDFVDFFVDLEVRESESFGLTIERKLTENLRLELLWSHQESELVEDRFLVFNPEEVLFDIDVDYYQVGLMYQWNPGRTRPFVVASLGTTVLNPAPVDLSTEHRFSGSIGGGAKFMFSDHVGLRLEGRLFTTALDGDDELYCDYDYDCEYDDDFLIQGEARAGLIFAF